MKLVIVTIDEPAYTNAFWAKVLEGLKGYDIKVFVAKGGKSSLPKGKNKFVYAISLLLIMGPVGFTMQVVDRIVFKTLKFVFSIWNSFPSTSIYGICKNFSITAQAIESPNHSQFINLLKSMEPDLILHQTQFILSPEFLAVPKFGVLNRHNALLPSNKGRLSPFWTIYKKEKEAGVTIHFVNEQLDSGDIIVQKSFNVSKQMTFLELTDKCYAIACEAMIEAVKKIEKGEVARAADNNRESSYNSIPTLSQAFAFRFSRITSIFKR